MKAVVLTAFGGVDKLVLAEVPDPRVGPKQVKVRVAGASINPIDWKIRSGAYQKRGPVEFPIVLGRDVAGQVVEVGLGVEGLGFGDRVMGLVSGGYAELVVADADVWAKVPAGMNLVDAAALPLVLLTGAQLIEEGVKPRAGDRVLVTGATGSVGRAAVFAAKTLGAEVWAGVRRTHKGEALKMNANGVIAIDDDGEVAALPALDSVADTVGGDTAQRVMARVKRGGTFASVLGEPASARERGLVVRTISAHPDGARLAALAQAVARGEFVIPIANRFSLSNVRVAQALAEGGAGGKIVLTA